MLATPQHLFILIQKSRGVFSTKVVHKIQNIKEVEIGLNNALLVNLSFYDK